MADELQPLAPLTADPADSDSLDLSDLGATVVQDAPAIAAAKPEGLDLFDLGATEVTETPREPALDLSDLGATPVEGSSQYQNVSTPPKAYTNSVREDLLSRWQTTYSKMKDGPERDRYGKLLAQAWDSHVDMQRYNDPLLFRAASTGTVTGGVGVMKGGLAGGEMLLSLPGIGAIPGAEEAKKSLRGVRENLEANQKLFEGNEKEFDKEAAIGQTAAGLTREMSGLVTQLLMAYSVPGAGRTAIMTRGGGIKLGEVALATLLGSEASANSLAAHPNDPKTAMLHGVLNAAGTVFLGKSGEAMSTYGGKVVPRAVKAVSDKLALTPIFSTLAHAQGGGADMAVTALSDYVLDTALTKDEFNVDEATNRMFDAYKSGAILGGAMSAIPNAAKFLKEKEAFKAIGETMKKRQEQLPTAAKAVADAREMFRKNEGDIEAGIAAKFKEGETLPEGYQEYFHGELDALQNLEVEYKDQFKSVSREREAIKTRREETQAHLEDLDKLDAEVRGDVIDPTGNRLVGQRDAAHMMVEGTEGAVRDIQGMRDGLMAELKGLDEREFAVNKREHGLDRNGKSVKDFVESEMDRLISDEAVVTEQSASERFTKDLDDAIGLEGEIATGGRTRPEPPIPGQESGDVPDTATDVELIDQLGHFTISGRQRDQNKMREFFDLEKMPAEVSKGFEETMIRAEQRGLIDNADTIAADAILTGRSLSDEEFAGVIERGRQNHGKYTDLMKAREKATTVQEKTDLDTRMKGLEDQQGNLTEAAYKTTNDIGRRLNLAKLTLQQAYDPMALLSKADRALASKANHVGRELHPHERENLLGIAKRISDEAAIKRKYPDLADPRFQTADYQEWLAKAEADRFIDKLRPRSFGGHALQSMAGVSNLSKTLTLSLDTSVLTLHGGLPGAVNPLITARAAKAFVETVRNPEALLKSHREIFEGRPNSDLYRKLDLGLADVTRPITDNEGILLGDMTNHIPVISRLHPANTVALNTIRADLFDYLVKMRGGRDSLTQGGAEALASFTRTASGRGGLGPFESSVRGLSAIYLAPRWFMSRFQHLWYALPNMYKALAARDYATTAVLGGAYAQQAIFTMAAGHVVAGIASLAYPGKASYTGNPLSPNFGLAEINGTMHDFSMGLRKPVVLVQAIGQALFGSKKLDAVQRVGSLNVNAFAPGGRAATELLMRKELGSGRKIDFSDPAQVAWFAAKHFIPLPVQAATRGLIEQGMSAKTADEVVSALSGIPAWDKKSSKKK